ncbi:MAG: tripartite tricarboxylate transporter substrate binding protein [Xanthobacteraceae bacterium]|nr:tripartite tricarboxylate transporter substrate binding protein [Xanthobacteraceae bacterium]
MKRIAAALLSLLALVANAAAQDAWPNRPIRMVVPLPAGASADVIGRLVAARLGERLGQTVVIENRAGASGAIGADAVARAAPDGYTLGMATTTTHVTNAIVNSKLAYDPIKDFTAVAMIGIVPYLLSVSPKLPAKDVRELIALAKAKPGALNYSSVGLGSVAHLATELFANMTGIKLNHVPYRSSAQAVVDLAEGRIDITFGTLGSSLPLMRDGRVKALAVSTAKRASQAPDVPTMVEAGVPGFETSLWFALVAPANLPVAIAARLNKEINAIVTDPAVIKGLDLQAMEPDPVPLDRMSSLIRDDLARWREIAAKAGVKAE